MELYSVKFLADCLVKLHGFRPVSFSMPYSKQDMLTEPSTNDVKCISVDRQKLYVSK